VHRIVDGQIRENWHVVDRLGLLHQLGAEVR
jgi:predicted ester cyclase